MNSLKREKGDTKEFRRLVFRSFGKGRRETQKEFRRLVLVEFFLAKGEESEKKYSTLLFSVKEQSLKTRKLRRLLAKEEEEEEEMDGVKGGGAVAAQSKKVGFLFVFFCFLHFW